MQNETNKERKKKFLEMNENKWNCKQEKETQGTNGCKKLEGFKRTTSTRTMK